MQGALVARSWAERTDCMESRAYPLDLEQLWVAQARKDDLAGNSGATWRLSHLDCRPQPGPLRNSVAACRTAHERWPEAAITMQQGMGSSEDSGGARIGPAAQLVPAEPCPRMLPAPGISPENSSRPHRGRASR